MTKITELDWQVTPLGDILLRRRIDPVLETEVFEVKLGDEFLMSSLFTTAEIELARLGLTSSTADTLDVLVGGLGLGYTAAAALEDSRIRNLIVVETLAPVIDWHRRELLPDTASIIHDARTQLFLGDFFQLIGQDRPFDPELPEQYDVILLDIDHTPDHVLHATHADFYTEAGLQRLHRHLKPHGVFALWSDDPPDNHFVSRLDSTFDEVVAHVIDFHNPLTRATSSNTVYVAKS